jgi:3D (Asp-Asp-Asp) domain-containing protein
MSRLLGFLVVTSALFSGISCSGNGSFSSGWGGSSVRDAESGSVGRTHQSFTRRRSLPAVRTTAYSDKENEMGGIYRNLSASGRPLKYGRLRSAAADWSHMPMGTLFRIKGLPYVYEVDDYGSSLVGTKTIDLYKPDLQTMRAWGTRRVDIEVIREGSYARSLEILKGRMKAPHVRQMVHSIAGKAL